MPRKQTTLPSGADPESGSGSGTGSGSGSAAGQARSVDLLLELRRGPLRAGLAEALRESIRSGRLAPGARLPATRALAADLGVARSTVTECYAELIAEGWLLARQGSGTRVAELAQPIPARAPRNREHLAPAGATRGLLPGAPDFAEFPRQQWLAAARRALATAPADVFGYGDPAGRIELREALSDYLGRVRGVRATPDQIVICSGFHHGLGLVADALKARGARTIAVESYGLDLYRSLLRDRGIRVPPIAVDSSGAQTHQLQSLRADAVLLTPAHQFPIGAALSPGRRATALDWAGTTGGVILEDDYDGEFRYDRAPIGALQGLAPDRVVYFGTASKSLAPAVRLGWMALPHDLVPGVLAAKGPVDTASAIDQLTLAEFLTSGGFDRHVRARRLGNRRRLDQLVATLARRAPGIPVHGIAAGLQTLLELPRDREEEAVRAASARGLRVIGLSEFHHEDAAVSPTEVGGLVVNFSAMSDVEWDAALALLGEVLHDLGLGD